MSSETSLRSGFRRHARAFGAVLIGLAALTQGASPGRARTFVDGFTLQSSMTAIEPAPTIVMEPSSVGAVAGKRVTLSVAASGSPGGSPLTYQWYFGEAAIPGAGARKATYTFVMSAARAGVYRVVVKNDSGETPSEPATVSFYTLPKVTVQPRGQTLADGAALSLVVQAVGTPAPTYQWSLDGVDIPDATGNTFAIGAVDAFDTGAYRVRVTNAGGSILSKPASIVVRSAPEIAASPEGAEVMIGAKVRLSVVAYGFPARRYQWRLNGEPIRGDAARRSSYTFTATLARAGVYDVVVSNALGAATSEPATVVVNQAPKVGAAPAAARLKLGASHTLSVAATGFPAPTYQWFKDGEPLEGETGSSLTFASLKLDDAGDYSVRVQNSFGVVTTKVAALDVSVAPYSLSTRSVINITGDGYFIDGEYIDLTQRLRFSGGKMGDGKERIPYTYSRQSPTQATIKGTTKVEGVTVRLIYVLYFNTTGGGTCTVAIRADGYGEVMSGSGTFTYSD